VFLYRHCIDVLLFATRDEFIESTLFLQGTYIVGCVKQSFVLTLPSEICTFNLILFIHGQMDTQTF